MEKNPGRYGIAALAIAALLSAGACDRGTDTATGLSERSTDTRTAQSPSSPSSPPEQTAASTAPGAAPAPGGLASSTDSAPAGQSSGAQTESGAGTAGVSGYTGPAGSTTGTTTGSTAGTTGTAPSGASSSAGGSATTSGPASGEMGASRKTLSSSDRNFIKEAAEDGMYEVAIARVAAEKAADPEVKSYASKLVDDHTKSNDQLRQIAESRNVTLPASLPAAKQRNVDRLSSAAGSDFDRQFLRMIGVKEHKEDIAEFERASRRARDAEIREFAKSALPTLREHMSTAQRLTANVGKKTGETGTTTTPQQQPQGYTGPESSPPPGSTGGSPGDMGSPATPQGSSTDTDRSMGSSGSTMGGQ